MSDKKKLGLSGDAILLIGVLMLIGVIAILIWLFGIVITLIAVGVGVGAVVLWVLIESKKIDQASVEAFNRRMCPKCYRMLRIEEIRTQVGSLNRSAIVGASVCCPKCGTEFHL